MTANMTSGQAIVGMTKAMTANMTSVHAIIGICTTEATTGRSGGRHLLTIGMTLETVPAGHERPAKTNLGGMTTPGKEAHAEKDAAEAKIAN